MYFQCACIANHPMTCNVLVLQGKADLQDRCTNAEWVALHEAASRGFIDCFNTLVQLGAPLHPRTSDGDTPRDLALRYGHVMIADLIDNFQLSAPRTNSSMWLHEHLDRQV